MKDPFFLSSNRQKALLTEIAEWQGTRFWRDAAGRAKKKVGADCVSFVHQVLVNVGAIKPIQFPPYVNFGGGSAMLELMVETLARIPQLEKIWPGSLEGEKLLPGDILVRTVELGDGRDFHHLAIYAGDHTLFHMRRSGLDRANVYDRFAIKNLVAIFRAYEQPATTVSDERSRADRGTATTPERSEVRSSGQGLHAS